METRRFGRTGHNSSIAIFGAFAVSQASQAEADVIMESVIAAGVNHIDVAPSYGHAEQRLGPWMARERERFFLGCKTMERTKEGAAAEMQRSLERLQVDSFDLYQLHAITSFEELDQVTRANGALEALIAARDAGLTRYIGITGHGVDVPEVFLEALSRYDFDSVLFPVNFIQYADPAYKRSAEELLEVCRQKDIGTMAIKSIAKRLWGDLPQTHITWYQPFEEMERIAAGVNFSLSQDITGICTSGDPDVLPFVLRACENFTPLTLSEQEVFISEANQYEPLFS
jgi:aryl-alcohol dehydrogenase-like predicted oxidoreductase